jgi:uncharacterized lipoprotein YmbA
MRLLALRLAGLSVVSTLICGCGAVRYPNYYELSTPAAIARGNTAPPLIRSVAVRQFDAPPFLRTGPIAYRESAERLGFYPYDRWAVDPRQSATAAMIIDLQETGVFQSVGLFDGHSAPECIMTGTIEHLEEVDTGKSVSIDVRVSARLINFESGEILWHGSASKDAVVEERSVSGVVSQLSLGLGSAVQELVFSMQDHLRSSPPHVAQRAQPKT